MSAALVTAAVATLVSQGLGMPAASAHDELLATAPVSDTTVPTAPPQVELEMSETPQTLGTRVLVSGPDGAPVSEGDVEVRGATVVQPLSTDLPAGAYAVAWRVTSSDSHQLAGTFTFTVAGGAAVEPAASPAAGPVAGPDAGSAGEPPAGLAVEPAGPDTGSSPAPAWLAGGAGLLVATGLGVRQLRRRP